MVSVQSVPDPPTTRRRAGPGRHGGVFAPLLAGVALTFSSHPIVTWAILAAPAVPAMVILGRLGTRLPVRQDRI